LIVAIIVAITRADGVMEHRPRPVIRAGDELVVLGAPQSVKSLEETIAI
jgi:Trk K+ transport system NAD-binding subunit